MSMLDSSQRAQVVDTSHRALTPYVAENTGRIALMRGPLLYCAEQGDNPSVDLRDLLLKSKEPAVRFEPDLLGGVAVVRGEARSTVPGEGWEDRLYRTVRPREGDKAYRCHQGNDCSLLRMGQPRAGHDARLA